MARRPHKQSGAQEPRRLSPPPQTPAWVERAALAGEMALFFAVGALVVGGLIVLAAMQGGAYDEDFPWLRVIGGGALLGGVGGIGWMSVFHFGALRRDPRLRLTMFWLLFAHAAVSMALLVHVLVERLRPYFVPRMAGRHNMQPETIEWLLAGGCIAIGVMLAAIFVPAMWKWYVRERHNFDQPGATAQMVRSIGRGIWWR